MRILFAANYTPEEHPIGGVQTWTETLSSELFESGHVVHVASPRKPPEEIDYDLAIISHTKLTMHFASAAKNSIAVCHGVVEEECPEADIFNTVFVSEECRNFWGGPGNALIIRQPINLDYWKPDAETARQPILALHSYRCKNVEPFSELAASLGLDFRHIRDARPDEVKSMLQKAAVVCGSGRAALEAMACGAATMIYDHRNYENEPKHVYELIEAQKANYSGRGKQCLIDKDAAALDAIRYGGLRHWIVQHHDAAIIAERLLHAGGFNSDGRAA